MTFSTGEGSSAAAQTVNSGSKVSKPADPTRVNHKFGGWYKDTACTVAYDFDSSVTGNMTLYAKWLAKSTLQGYYDQSTGGMFFYTDSTMSQATDEAYEGDTVYVKVEAASGNVQQNLLQSTADGLVLTKLLVTYLKNISEPENVTYVTVTENTTDGYFTFTMPGAATTVEAAFGPQYTYVDHSVSEGTVTTTDATTKVGYVYLNGGGFADEVTLPAGFYVLDNTNAFSKRITVGGDVKVLLLNSSMTNAGAGITVAGSNSLTIYAQSTSDNAGQLIAKGGNENGNAGIGGGSGESNGPITIHGGVITATGGSYNAGGGAGIGGGTGKPGGTVTIYDGVVTATGGTGVYSAAGIGGGDSSNGGTVTIYGGSVKAMGGGTSSSNAGEGIGHGYTASDSDSGALTVGSGMIVYASNSSMESVTDFSQAAGLPSYMRLRYMKVAPKDPVDLANFENVSRSSYIAQDGDILAGTLTDGWRAKISIASGATVTLKGVTINGTHNNTDTYKHAGITCEGDATIILEGTNSVTGFHENYPGIYVPANHTLTIKGTGVLARNNFLQVFAGWPGRMPGPFWWIGTFGRISSVLEIRPIIGINFDWGRNLTGMI